MPFYTDHPDNSLRFGDIIRCFPISTDRLERLPVGEGTVDPREWSIGIERPRFVVVMTPCCSIERKAILVAPLQEIRVAFLRNPHFQEDLTRINRKVAPEKSVPPDAWENMSDERRGKLISAGAAFTFLDTFVFQRHELLGEYRIITKDGEVTSGYYMVDFKEIARLECDDVERGKALPLGVKVLELSIQARRDLRDKIGSYFSRPAEEDVRVLAEL